jgi:hypothetical protein
MTIKYNIELDNRAFLDNLERISRQIYKLLPVREEGGEWRKPLSTLIQEISGMNELLLRKQKKIFVLLCKLEGLLNLTKDEDYYNFRRTIFECISICNKIEGEILNGRT